MRLAAFLFVTLGAIAQTAVGPAVSPCPPDQIIQATPQSAGSPFYKLTCIALDPSVKLDTTATPPTVTAIAPVNPNPQTKPVYMAGMTFPPGMTADLKAAIICSPPGPNGNAGSIAFVWDASTRNRGDMLVGTAVQSSIATAVYCDGLNWRVL